MGSDIFGALFASVSGLDAQSTNLSIISNNVANVNTTGYKATEAEFETLVSGTGSTTSYASGGVTANNRQLVDQQGLLQSTGSSTDIAIQGNGLFVVNSKADGSGDVLYTRAGSFTQDSSGNFVNSAGEYLQGWPLNNDGLLPGAPGNTTDLTSSANLSSLQTVNVENVAGKASASTSVALSVNLNSGQVAYPGAGENIAMDANDTSNFGITAADVIVPSATDDLTLTAGDKITVSTGLDPTGYTYTYGGVDYSRNVTTGAANGASGVALQAAVDLTPRSGGGDTAAFTFNPTTPTSMTINLGSNTAAEVGVTKIGQVVNLANTGASGGLAVNNITSLDGDYYVTSLPGGSGGNTMVVTIPSTITPPSPLALTTSDVFEVTSGNATANPTATLTLTAAVPAGIQDGDVLTFANGPTVNDVSFITTGSNTFTVTHVAGDVITFTANGQTSTGAANGTGDANANTTMFDNTGNLTDLNTATVTSRLFNGHILDATSATDPFITTPSDFTTAALSFTITTAGTESTFTYTPTAPNAELGQFSDLNNLATAISDTSGLSARVVNGQLYVSPVNSDAGISFANGSITGSDSSPPLGGIDWVGELGLTPTIAASSNTFSTLQGLANLVNNSAGLTGTISNPLGNANLDVNVNDPLDTIKFADTAGNTGSLVAALGLGTSLDGGAYAAESVTNGPAYDPTNADKNMAGGDITPQFSRSITVYDSLGAAHNLNIAFINTGVNTWAAEIYVQPATGISGASPIDASSGSTATGLIAAGSLTFNGDGSLKSVSTDLLQPIAIDWSDGSEASSVTMNWGTAGALGTGETNGMSQFDSPYVVNFVNPNGTPVGDLTSVSIGSTGLVTASFSNGQTQNLYQIPLASFSDPDQLESLTGNTFAQTATSGQVELQEAGSSSVGTIASSSLEQSNVELADQLTTMIVAQQAYQANTKVIATVDTLLTSLDQIFQ